MKTTATIITLTATFAIFGQLLFAKNNPQNTNTPKINPSQISQNSLTWDATSKKLTFSEELTQQPFSFKFKNTSGKVLTIGKIKTSCTCTVAQLNKTTYQPGEVGELSGTIKTASTSGTRTQKIDVPFEVDGKSLQNTIIVSVDVPTLYEISPRRLDWTSNDTSPQKIKIKFKTKKPVMLTGFEKSRHFSNIKYRTISKGREYEVMLTPDHKPPFLELIKIRTDHKGIKNISLLARGAGNKNSETSSRK